MNYLIRKKSIKFNRMSYYNGEFERKFYSTIGCRYSWTSSCTKKNIICNSQVLEIISILTFFVFIAICTYKKVQCKRVSSYQWVFKNKSWNAFEIQIFLNFICNHKIHSLCFFSGWMISTFQITFLCDL